jgi:putative transposase
VSGGKWSQRTGARLRFIQPGKPIQSALAESLIGRFRDECLNENWFGSLAEARRIIEAWRLTITNADRTARSAG